MPSDEVPIGDAVRIVGAARRVTVLTGAGISTDSGIADFRGPQGLWTRDPAAERRSDLTHYLADPEIRAAAWRARLALFEAGHQPNAGHRALVELEQQGRLQALVTQNIDGLHQAAGSAAALVHEVHGSVASVACVGCGRHAPMDEALARVRAGDADPACPTCGGIQKSTTVLFGESLDPDVLDAALMAAVDTDVLLTVGTSLAVGPVNQMVPQAARAGVPVVILNAEPTELDELADVVVHAAIADALPALLGVRGS
jgi:NAD-dependent deacetylase